MTFYMKCPNWNCKLYPYYPTNQTEARLTSARPNSDLTFWQKYVGSSIVFFHLEAQCLAAFLFVMLRIVVNHCKFIISIGISLFWMNTFKIYGDIVRNYLCSIWHNFLFYEIKIIDFCLLLKILSPAWLVWLSGLSTSLWNKGSPVWFRIRAHAWVVGQVPRRGCIRGNHTLIFLSLFFSLPFPLSKNKINKIL